VATKSASPANALISCQALSFIKETRKKKDARRNGNNLVKSPTRTWTIIHQVRIMTQISNCHQMMG
jgi:hypothetical protein